MSRPVDVEGVGKQLVAGDTPQEERVQPDALLGGQVSSILEGLDSPPSPLLRRPPREVAGFRVRVDLDDTNPPVWRRLELPGDLTLPRVHDMIQASMGWTDSHQHRFRTGHSHRSPYFVTALDIDEGEEGLLEDDARFDQLVAAEGDAIWYEYDFGDGWDHVVMVEEVLEQPPSEVRVLEGQMACPPEDCGGAEGYQELAAWARSGYEDALLPGAFEDAEGGRGWLPLGWHPDHFDVDEANAALALVLAEPVVVAGELADLLRQLERRGVRGLRELLSRPMSHGPSNVSNHEEARLTETYRIFLDVLDQGVVLTSAGYLPPKVVEQIAERTGITGWWVGKTNREDLTPPVAVVRESARALGLVSVRKGRLTPTAAGTRCRHDHRALWQHIVGRLPLGKKEFDRQAGWMTLAVVGSGVPTQEWRREISDLLFALGWRSGADPYSRPPAHSPTLDVLDQLAGAASTGWRRSEGIDMAVAATARAVIRSS